ncbi:MAG: prolyl oligopeptidase family serine peptidase [Fidelibacterota bacterium]
MKNPSIIIIVASFLVIALHQIAPEELRYPVTEKGDTIDTYFDTTIADPYRWLEDDYSNSTKAWVSKQNAFTSSYMRKIPYRRKIEKRLTEIWNYPSQRMPFKKGDKYYFYKNDGLQSQSVLYVQDSPTSEPVVFMDPNQLSNDGTIALGGTYFSNDHKYMGYSVSISGSDWKEYYVKDLSTGELLPDHLTWVKFSGMAWRGDGFYYKRYPTPDENEELSAANEHAKVYYHRLGTSQEADELIFYEPDKPKLAPSIYVSHDERFMFLYRSSGTYGNMLAFKDTKLSEENWTHIVDDLNSNCWIMDNIGGQLIAQTDRNAPFKKIVRIDPKKPQESNWETLIEGTQDQVLSSVNLVGGKFFAHFTQDVTSVWKVYDLDGNFLHNVDLPGKGIVRGFGGKKDQMITWYTFNNSVSPSTIYQYNIKQNISTVYKESEAKFDRENFVLTQDFYPSKDGTMIPIFIAHKKGLKMDGKRPTLLYAYGGFNISIKPHFSKANSILYENDGVYAIANLRGGSEYGQDWHEAGMLHNKQNVFDDFIAAAEYLERSGITNPNYLAIRGGSNGGLLIGAVLNQRPDICKVAFPEVGVMDMLRYEKFTIGHAWAVEYGSVAKKEHFKNLVGYSPLHTIETGTHYPSVLVYTADHDDRVVPAHSFKYVATLQNGQGGSEPILVRIGQSAGHGAGKPTKKIIEEYAEKWAFMFYEMGLDI